MLVVGLLCVGVFEDTLEFAFTYSSTGMTRHSKTTRCYDRLSLERARHELKKRAKSFSDRPPPHLGPPKGLHKGAPVGVPKGMGKGFDKGKSQGKGVAPPPVMAPAANPSPRGPP